MTRTRQALYGLVVDAEMELHQERPAPDGGLTDVHVRLGEPVPADVGQPPGEVLLDLAEEDGSWYCAVRRPAGDYLLRFHGACDIEITDDLSEAVVRPAVGVPEGLATVLTTGAMLAFQLYLRGSLVLHASAVDLGGVAVAVAGHSGMGKSTLAALLCSDGARLITDDVLRVQDEDTLPRVRLGSTELRLRHGARGLAETFRQAPARRTSADGREVLGLPDDARDHLPLGAVVVPQPSRGGATQVQVERLPAKEALLTLLGFPRLGGWRDAAVLRRQFEATCALVERVPVVVAQVPWGPPFAQGLGGELRAALRPHLDG